MDHQTNAFYDFRCVYFWGHTEYRVSDFLLDHCLISRAKKDLARVKSLIEASLADSISRIWDMGTK